MVEIIISQLWHFKNTALAFQEKKGERRGGGGGCWGWSVVGVGVYGSEGKANDQGKMKL